LDYPNMVIFANAGHNLQGGSDIYSKEQISFANLGTNYQNEAKTLQASSVISYDVRQFRDRSDPFEFRQGNITWNNSMTYIPTHELWWAHVRFYVTQALEDDPRNDFLRKLVRKNSRFDESRSRVRLDVTLGKKLGPKWTAESRVELGNDGGFRRLTLIFQRDLHDFIADLRLRFDNTQDDNEKSSGLLNNISFQFALRTKTTFGQAPVGSARIKTLIDKRKAAALEES
ncbi:MAG: hypothetical protein V2A74_02260, partial [bacterium]